jgi:Alginate export
MRHVLNQGRRLARSLALLATLGTLLLLGQGVLRGQDVSAAPPVRDNALENPPPQASPSTGPSSSGGERSWSGPPRSEGPKTFWETVWPTIVPYPRTGNFAIAPSGPGYYTLWGLIQGDYLQERPKNPYLQWGQNANPFFNVDFRYLDNPNNTETFFLDSIKRIHLGDNWLFSTGGEVRDRYTSLENAYLYNKKPLAGSDESFNLFRTRVYGDLSYLDLVRVYGEFTSADSSPQKIPHLSSDVDKADILNLFVEAKVMTIDDYGLYIRGGRQELLFGSQRLISPSDWSNELRTFQGIRGLFHTDKIEEDIFWVAPVVVNTGKLDSIDDKQVFAGNYFKYRFNKDISLDLYYLYLENDNQSFAGQKGLLGGYDVNTFGGRFVGQAGDHGQYLWDFEGAYQFGNWSNQTISANMYVAGVGYWFKNVPSIPTFWVYYDHASGTREPVTGGQHDTFNPLFPSGHNYYNSEDLFGRQNINDFHLELAFFPTNWMRFTLGYHVLSLDEAKDALYNPSGSVVRQDTTGKAGTDIGQSLSASVQFHVDNHQMINVSYAHLYSGSYIKNTAVNPAAARDSDSIWFTYSLKW